MKAMFTLTVFEILLFEGSLGIMTRTAGYREQKGYIFSEKPKKRFGFCWNCLKSYYLTA